MDSLFTKIIQEIEAYLLDSNLTKENNIWIRLELLRRCQKLSCYSYETILHALRSKQSNLIELSAFEPLCIRRRDQELRRDSIQDNRTVIVSGLPHDIRCEALITFFNGFYSVEEIKVLSAANRFNGQIHVIFHTSEDASAFVQQSKYSAIVYAEHYPLTCRLFTDGKSENPIKENRPHSFGKGSSFSTRLANHSPRVSLTVDKSNTVPSRPSSVLSQASPCLRSTTCATEQILFCQNLPPNRSKSAVLSKELPATNKFSYNFYKPGRLLKQTHRCIVVSALNPHCFTVQLAQDAREFDRFQREINAFYNATTDKQFHYTSEQICNNLCVISADTKSSDENKIWNRSQILDFDPSDNTVNLFHVDLGTWEEYVPIHRLRRITERFHQHEVFSITCRLAHILPQNSGHDQSTWTDEATDQFLAVIDQMIPEVEFLMIAANGSLQTNLFVTRSGQAVCVNDYMIHIRQARHALQSTRAGDADDDDGQMSIQSDEHDTDGKGPLVHPVIALYNRLGEILQRSLTGSCVTSASSTSISSLSTSSPLAVKLIHVDTDKTVLDREAYSQQSRLLPIIFVRYKKTILLPDFNICRLLKTVHDSVDPSTIQHHASTARCDCVYITSDSDFDLFSQLSPLNDTGSSKSIALYPLDFTEHMLKYYSFQENNVFLALEHARCAQLHASDLAQWFAMENELDTTCPVVPVDTNRVNQANDHSAPITLAHRPPSNPIRLPFSNRLIRTI